MEELKRNVSELKSRNGDLMSTINDLNRKNADLKNRNVDLERQLEQTRDDRNKRDLRDKLALYENQVGGACTSVYVSVCCMVQVHSTLLVRRCT